jgi:hypothetical protein
MFLLQNLIHYLEVGAGGRYFSSGFRVMLAGLTVVLLAVGYNLFGFHNLATQEAMDSAQLARNISEGKGYTTFFIRPLSLVLIKEQNKGKGSAPDAAGAADRFQIRGMHPDIANPPVYPFALAGLMKVLPFHYTVDTTHSFWSRVKNAQQREFWRYQPDFLITLFNQLLLVAVVVLVFFLARRLFDREVAWVSSAVVVGTELYWRFSISGLSTMLLLLIFLSLVFCLSRFAEVSAEPEAGVRRLLLWAAACGLLVGVGALTRYAFLWLIIPVVAWLWWCAGRRRVAASAAALAVFAFTLAPWIARNYNVSGTPFGTATYTLIETTAFFPENRLQRSLNPSFAPVYLLNAARTKLLVNSRQILQNDLPRLGGTWVSALFLTGLLIGFKNPTVRRLRYFVLACIVTLVVVQALGRTQLSEDSPDINSENLLVLLGPLVVIYGVSLFFLLLDQIVLPLPQLRYAVVGLFGAVASLPLLLIFVPPRTVPLAYPPYYPPAIQQAVSWTRPDELMMSDIPWAVAWYGQAQCVWLTLDCQSSFLAINDFEKPVQALYISRLTLDGKFLPQIVRAGDKGWGPFILGCLFRKAQGAAGPPPDFPLRFWQSGWPDQFLLTFREKWPKAP